VADLPSTKEESSQQYQAADGSKIRFYMVRHWGGGGGGGVGVFIIVIINHQSSSSSSSAAAAAAAAAAVSCSNLSNKM